MHCKRAAVPRFLQRLLSAHPKFQWFDAGVFVELRPAGPIDRPQELAGAALEGLVAQHLRAWIDYSGADLTLSFWRTRAGSEVDFVLYGRDGFWAIEVKHAGAALRLAACLAAASLSGAHRFSYD